MAAIKWSRDKFFIKITSSSLWAFLAWGALTFIVCIIDGDHPWINTVVIGWIIISGLFVGGKVLVDALAIAVSKAEIKANVNLNGGIGK